jgi:hypothetical protein
MASKKGSKSKELAINEKVNLLNYLSTHTTRETAGHFDVSLGTVSNIKKRKKEYLALYQENGSSDRKRKYKKTENEKINENTWQWFLKARYYNIPVSGPLIQEAALKFAEVENKLDFKASKGWLEKFTIAHNITFKSLSGNF